MEALDELLEDDLKVESIMKSAARTQIIMRHVNRMLDIYKVVCENSLDETEQRHYRVIEALYLRDRPLSPAATAFYTPAQKSWRRRKTALLSSTASISSGTATRCSPQLRRRRRTSRTI